MRFLLSCLLALSLLVPMPSVAQDGPARTLRVKFSTGQTGATLREVVHGRESVVYVLDARKGQVMTVALDAPGRGLRFQVLAPLGGSAARLAVSGDAGRNMIGPNRFRATLPANGDYRILVYQTGPGAQRGERAPFALTVNVTGQPDPGRPDPGKPGAGGPDFWRVTGLGGELLNVRSGPSTRYPVQFTLRQGEIVRNLGCTRSGAITWCQVHRPYSAGETGWASASYLTPSAVGPGAQPKPPEPKPQPKPGSASGTLLCSILTGTQRCYYTVERTRFGDATMTIVFPRGARRTIRFEGGRAVWSDGTGKVTSSQKGNEMTVSVGSLESFRFDAKAVTGR